jgi:hypothetical protein
MHGRRAEGSHQSRFQFPSLRPHCATMLRVTFLGCVLILPALFASAFAEELDFGAENLFANIAQIPLNHSDNYQPVCHGISRSISPASQVFLPGAVLAFLPEKSLMSTPGSSQFAEDITLWINSSSQISACSVRPGTAEDLSSIVRDMTYPFTCPDIQLIRGTAASGAWHDPHSLRD